MKFNKKFEYDDGMDKEVIDLCNVMNALPGIETTDSCCGHSASPFNIFFNVTSSDDKGLFFLTRCVDRRYWKYGYLWNIELSVGDQYDTIFPITYLLNSGPIVGEDAYEQAKDLIENMNHHLNITAFMKYFDLDTGEFEGVIDG